VIVDTHTHFYDPSRPQGVPWPGPDNELLYRTVLPEHYKALAEPEGVTGTVVVEASAWLEDNEWILDLAAADPFVLGLVGHIDPNRDAFASELERFAKHPRFCGIRCGSGYFNDIKAGNFLRDLRLLAECDRAFRRIRKSSGGSARTAHRRKPYWPRADRRRSARYGVVGGH
jgi:L-fuconolactonase